jgi:hypothetical protein
VLANASRSVLQGQIYSLDDFVRIGVWSGIALIYLALAYLTFVHRWRPDVIPVSIE